MNYVNEKKKNKRQRLTCPSGETARYRTRNVCPVRVANCKRENYIFSSLKLSKKLKIKEDSNSFTLDMVGYFQTMIWF